MTLLPRPLVTRPASGSFTLGPQTVVVAPAELAGVARRLQDALRPSTGLPLPVVAEAGDAPALTLSVDPALAPEGYRLSIRSTGVDISGGSPAGVFYGCQSLLQLLPVAVYRRATVDGVTWTVDAQTVDDAPRFAWRGLMLDVARHFQTKRDVMRVIDLMSIHRLNTLHLHLTDDQGWRIEIRAFPKLTEVGGWRTESQHGHGPTAGADGRPHGGFYSQDDIRELVAYAAERFVTIVPEIETPGHVQAAIAAYPELGVTGEEHDVWTRWGINPLILNVEESTVDFFRAVFDEVVELFPSAHIGVGGDEAKKDQWRTDPRTQERMRELGVDTEEQLQSWFIRQLDDHLTARGRSLFGWDEILEGGLASGATVASWRGTFGALAAARAGNDVVACPDDEVYLDYRQSDLPGEPIPVGFPLGVADVYAFEPVPAGLEENLVHHVLGGQANLWTEHLDSPRAVDYMMFPRLCALAEAVWAPAERDLAEFLARLEHHLGRLDALGVEYRAADGPAPWQQRPDAPGKPITRAQRLAIQAELLDGLKREQAGC